MHLADGWQGGYSFDIQTMKTLIFLTLLISAWTVFAQEAGGLNRRLSERVREIIFAEPLLPVGKTSEQQLVSVLEQMSDRYEKQWEEPLPVALDLSAIRHLRSHPDMFSGVMGGHFKDVPLTETLRIWCGMAELEWMMAEGRIVIIKRRE